MNCTIKPFILSFLISCFFSISNANTKAEFSRTNDFSVLTYPKSKPPDNNLAPSKNHFHALNTIIALLKERHYLGGDLESEEVWVGTAENYLNTLDRNKVFLTEACVDAFKKNFSHLNDSLKLVKIILIFINIMPEESLTGTVGSTSSFVKTLIFL